MRILQLVSHIVSADGVCYVVSAAVGGITVWAAATWEASGTLLLLFTLLASLVTFVWHSSRLATRVENMESTIKDMTARREVLLRENENSHRRLWEQLNQIRQVVADNTTRLSYIEDRSGIARRPPRKRNPQDNLHSKPHDDDEEDRGQV